MSDSRTTMSKWLLLVATLLLWGAVVISVTAGAGVPWLILVLAVLATVMAVLVWTRMP